MTLVSPFFADFLVFKRQTAPSFNLGLSLSNDAAIEPILALIPFFAVGITAFATFSVSLVMSRISLVPSYIYAAVLAAFIGALLDLVQLLLRGAQNTQLGLGLNAVRGLVDAREIFFALSFGFRFLFFWATVAEGYDRETSRIASWDRWGYIGFALKYLTLLSCFAVPVLQVIWRLGSLNNTFVALYVADSTIQITVSALFILKIFLTLFITPSTRRGAASQYYSFPAVGLLFNLAVGIADLISNSFSETTLGRFVQSLEMYFMILFVLALSFKSKSKARPTSSFQALPRPFSEKSAPPGLFRAPPRLPTPDYLSNETAANPRKRASIVRLSSWLSPRPAPRAPSGVPFQSDDVEQGLSPRSKTSSSEIAVVSRGPASPPPPPVSPPPASRPPVFLPPTPRPAPPPRLNIPSPASPRPRSRERSPAPLEPPPSPPTMVPPAIPDSAPSSTPRPISFRERTPRPTSVSVGVSRPMSFAEGRSRPGTQMSFESYYGTDRASRRSSLPLPPPFGRDTMDSPIYGLNGIIRQFSSPRNSLQPQTPARGSESSFDQLLKEQQALDNSIRLLKLFSPRDGAASLSDTETIGPQSSGAKRSNSTNARLTALSNGSQARTVSARSEFSLSVFPEPPEAEDEANMRARRVTIGPRSPRSTLGESMFLGESSTVPRPPHERLDSTVTRYDVTSFIGGFSSPEESPDTSTEAESRPAERPSSTDPRLSLKPLLLTAASAAPIQSVAYVPSNREPLKPLILGRGVRAVGAKRGMTTMPRPLQVDDEAEDEDVYERPRQPPS